MARCIKATSLLAAAGICSITCLTGLVARSDPLPPDTTYRPLPTRPLSAVKADDEAQKPQVMARQSDLLNQRYDLANRPMPGVMMSGAKKPVQGGVRVKLPPGVTWDDLAAMSPEEVRQRGLLPAGFMPLPHVKQATGGQVFPNRQIDEIRRLHKHAHPFFGPFVGDLIDTEPNLHIEPLGPRQSLDGISRLPIRDRKGRWRSHLRHASYQTGYRRIMPRRAPLGQNTLTPSKETR